MGYYKAGMWFSAVNELEGQLKEYTEDIARTICAYNIQADSLAVALSGHNPHRRETDEIIFDFRNGYGMSFAPGKGPTTGWMNIIEWRAGGMHRFESDDPTSIHQYLPPNTSDYFLASQVANGLPYIIRGRFRIENIETESDYCQNTKWLQFRLRNERWIVIDYITVGGARLAWQEDGEMVEKDVVVSQWFRLTDEIVSAIQELSNLPPDKFYIPEHFGKMDIGGDLWATTKDERLKKSEWYETGFSRLPGAPLSGLVDFDIALRKLGEGAFVVNDPTTTLAKNKCGSVCVINRTICIHKSDTEALKLADAMAKEVYYNGMIDQDAYCEAMAEQERDWVIDNLMNGLQDVLLELEPDDVPADKFELAGKLLYDIRNSPDGIDEFQFIDYDHPMYQSARDNEDSFWMDAEDYCKDHLLWILDRYESMIKEK